MHGTGIFTYICLIFMVDVSKLSIHGWYEIPKNHLLKTSSTPKIRRAMELNFEGTKKTCRAFLGRFRGFIVDLISWMEKSKPPCFWKSYHLIPYLKKNMWYFFVDLLLGKWPKKHQKVLFESPKLSSFFITIYRSITSVCHFCSHTVYKYIA